MTTLTRCSSMPSAKPFFKSSAARTGPRSRWRATKLTSGTGQVSKFRKVNYIQGWASIVDARTIKVKTSGGEPARGVMVTAGEARDHLGIKVFTSSDGSYRLEGLPAGQVEVHAGKHGLGRAGARLSVKGVETLRWDAVLAQDVDSGEIAFKPVLKTTVRPAVSAGSILTSIVSMCAAVSRSWIPL